MEPGWFPIALITALATATGDAVLKARFSRLSAAGMAVVRSVAPVPFLLPYLLIRPWPATDQVFWQTLAILLPFELLALILYMEALKSSPLSLSIPFLAFTPVFIILTGWTILGEKITATGLLGILFTVTGAYCLHFKAGRKQWSAPFKAIMREKGSRLMLAVAAIYSLTSVLGKRAILHSEPFFFACFYFCLLGLVVPVVVFSARWIGIGSLKGLAATGTLGRQGRIFSWIAVGIAQAIMVLSHMWAIHLVNAAYMIAVKRTSLLFSVVYGKVIFDEIDFRERLSGAGLMVIGVAIIVLVS